MANLPQTLDGLMAAINARLVAQFAAINNVAGPLTAGIAILSEDAGDLQTQVTKALDQVSGMLVLIGEPYWENESPFNPETNAKVHLQIAIGENPTLWRDAAKLKPTCRGVSNYITAFLAQFQFPGCQKLRVKSNKFVPDKKRNLREIDIETMFTIEPINN